MNKDEIAQWYGENYDGMVGFVRNKKKGGDGGRVLEEQAEDIVANTFVYFLNNPDKFNPKWIWNKLIQMRKDFHSLEKTQAKLKKEYVRLELEVDSEYEEFTEEEASVLREEVEAIEDERKQRIVREYMRGDMLDATERQVVSRFKGRLKEKYSGNLDDGYRE